jgi:uncharacterized protein YkwD
MDHESTQQLLTLINVQRERLDIDPLELDLDMCLAAWESSRFFMPSNGQFHNGSPYSQAIFVGPRSHRAAISGFMDSPGHRAILLSGAKAGIAYWSDGNETYYTIEVE